MTRQVRVIAGQLGGLTERAVRAISLEVTANLIEATPVDTGWARANWVPAIGVSRDSPVNTRPDASLVSAQVAKQQAGMASLGGYRLASGPVFVSNNVPYIVFLNEGSSRQAPAAFVQAAIQAGVNQVVRTLR